MEIARTLALVAGVLLVGLTVWSVFTSLVVPRAASSRLQKVIGRLIGGGGRAVVPHLQTYVSKDRLLSLDRKSVV